MRLTWSRASEDEERFEIGRRDTGKDWIIVHTVAAGKEEILDGELSAETTYGYRIRAVNEAGASEWSDPVEVTTPALPVPDTPFGVMAKATGPTSISITWIMPYPSCEQSFELEESLTGDENDFTAVLPAPGAGDRSYQRDGLQPQTTYYYRLRAVNTSGMSDYSGIASATTLKKDERLPDTPFDVIASALSESRIRISWAMPDPMPAEGFSLERSRSGREDDFTEIAGSIHKEIRTYVDSLLLAETTYYYRLRAFNVHGSSDYSAIVSATTAKEPLSPELVAAMDEKEVLIPRLERLFPDRDENRQQLRTMFGAYAMGYDESAARALLADWRDEQPSNSAMAVEAMKRYTLVERLLLDAMGTSSIEPSIPGASEIAHQAMLPASLSVKNFLATSIAWKNERRLIDESEQPLLDMIMSDLSFALFDASSAMLSLCWERSPGLAACLVSMHRDGGAIEGNSSTLLNSVSTYYKERLLNSTWLQITQHVIDQYEGHTRSRSYAGSLQEAEAKYHIGLDSLRNASQRVIDGFSSYQPVCQALDRAYTISTTQCPTLTPFARKLTVLKPDLLDASHHAIAEIRKPMESLVSITYTSELGDVSPLQPLLTQAAQQIFNPTFSLRKTQDSPLFKAPRVSAVLSDDEDLEEDWDMLYALRGKILEEDVDYVRDAFEPVRRQGKISIAHLDWWQRRIHGIPVWILSMDRIAADDYYRTIASLHRAKARRSVLSVSLADYMLDPQEYKIQPLVAEIDSIIGWMCAASDGAELKFQEVFLDGWIQLPLLIVDNPALMGKPDDGPRRYELSLIVRNYGPMTAQHTDVLLDILEGDAQLVSDAVQHVADLAPESVEVLSYAFDIDPEEKFLTIATTVTTEGYDSFMEIHSIPVPEITTAIRGTPSPATIALLPNLPNPFAVSTQIRFSLSDASAITLSVADVLGREVTRLVDAQIYRAGTHTISFHADGLPPGAYFCRLQSESHTVTRSMLLLR